MGFLIRKKAIGAQIEPGIVYVSGTLDLPVVSPDSGWSAAWGRDWMQEPGATCNAAFWENRQPFNRCVCRKDFW